MKNIYLLLFYLTLSAFFFLFIMTNYIAFYISKVTSIVELPYLFFYYLLTIIRILVVLEAYYKKEINKA